LYNIVNSECEVLVQSFKIESNGEFQYLGVADSGVPGDLFGVSNVAVLENNKFAFQTLCGGDSFPGGGSSNTSARAMVCSQLLLTSRDSANEKAG